MDSYIRDVNYTPINTLELSEITEFNKFWLNKKQNNYFKIFHQNIRSLNKNFDGLKIFQNALNVEYDCIVLTEAFKIPDTSLFQ